MPEITIDVEIWCSCGAGLCHQAAAHRSGRGIVVEPCEKCLADAKSEGYQEAQDEAINS